ncbi:MAG TPA: peptide deformylase [Actinomycetota bacterium]
MSVLPIRILGDPVLREPSRDVETFDELMHRLYEDMLETMYNAPGVGLAAPQIGLSLRFFVYDAEKGNSPGALANPVLSELEGEIVEDEGCLSIPGLWYPTGRAERVRVDGLDLQGKPATIRAEGFLARVFQHETDHLNGLLFLDRLSEEDRRKAMGMLREHELGAMKGRSGRSST